MIYSFPELFLFRRNHSVAIVFHCFFKKNIRTVTYFLKQYWFFLKQYLQSCIGKKNTHQMQWWMSQINHGLIIPQNAWTGFQKKTCQEPDISCVILHIKGDSFWHYKKLEVLAWRLFPEDVVLLWLWLQDNAAVETHSELVFNPNKHVRHIIGLIITSLLLSNILWTFSILDLFATTKLEDHGVNEMCTFYDPTSNVRDAIKDVEFFWKILRFSLLVFLSLTWILACTTALDIWFKKRRTN